MSDLKNHHDLKRPVAIIDYDMGNLFSVARACEMVGIKADITNRRDDILNAAGVILPGVGAFGDAMEVLCSHNLVDTIKEIINRDVPFMGICLGMQLLLSRSQEFGVHAGLDVVSGEVLKFPGDSEGQKDCKVPQVQWNMANKSGDWKNSLLAECSEKSFMYFVHSYYVKPRDASIVVSTTEYASTVFCSSFQRGNLFACQFHPEKSGQEGLLIYKAFGQRVAHPAR